MKVKGIIVEDFINYKEPAMFISTYTCSFKCDRECGRAVCQNSALATAPIIELDDADIIDLYMKNNITKSIVIGGLEPFDDFKELKEFCAKLRLVTYDDIVIYTGYDCYEISDKVTELVSVVNSNLIVKYGRFIPNQLPHYDEVLGVNLASDNQYGEKEC